MSSLLTILGWLIVLNRKKFSDLFQSIDSSISDNYWNDYLILKEVVATTKYKAMAWWEQKTVTINYIHIKLLVLINMSDEESEHEEAEEIEDENKSGFYK